MISALCTHANLTLVDGTFTGLPSNDSSITYFRGIRYAEPPTGDLRFSAPVSPPQTDLGEVNATEVCTNLIALDFYIPRHD